MRVKGWEPGEDERETDGENQKPEVKSDAGEPYDNEIQATKPTG